MTLPYADSKHRYRWVWSQQLILTASLYSHACSAVINDLAAHAKFFY